MKKDQMNEDPLFTHIINNEIEEAIKLIDHYDKDQLDSNTYTSHKLTVFHVACYYSSIKIVKKLYEKTQNINISVKEIYPFDTVLLELDSDWITDHYRYDERIKLCKFLRDIKASFTYRPKYYHPEISLYISLKFGRPDFGDRLGMIWLYDREVEKYRDQFLRIIPIIPDISRMIFEYLL